MMINSSRRRSLILSSREDEERKKASACGVSARASDAFWKRLSTEKKWLCFCEKKLKKRNFSSVCRHWLTLLYGETEEKQRHQRHNKTMSAVKKLIPLMDRVLVERAVAATKTSGGILLSETVGSKVRRMNSHSHSSSLSSLVFFLWISILVCLSERERERALHIGRTFSLRAETEDDDGRVFFFLWWVELSLFCAWLTIGWCFSLSFLFY